MHDTLGHQTLSTVGSIRALRGSFHPRSVHSIVPGCGVSRAGVLSYLSVHVVRFKVEVGGLGG